MYNTAMNEEKTYADKINDWLSDGNIVTVTTYAHQWEYSKKHVGFFKIGADKNLYVRSGKSWNCLTYGKGENLLVGIKFYTRG